MNGHAKRTVWKSNEHRTKTEHGSINQSTCLLCTTAGRTIHVNVGQVKVGLYKFTLPALHALKKARRVS